MDDNSQNYIQLLDLRLLPWPQGVIWHKLPRKCVLFWKLLEFLELTSRKMGVILEVKGIGV